MPALTHIGVKYIGRRPSFHDRLFGTGLDFVQGQTHAVIADVARKFLHHTSEFERDDTKAAVSAKALSASEALEAAKAKEKLDHDAKALDEVQYLRDQVKRMEKPELEAMAKNHYGQDIDKRRSVQALREEVVSLIDRYGVV